MYHLKDAVKKAFFVYATNLNSKKVDLLPSTTGYADTLAREVVAMAKAEVEINALIEKAIKQNDAFLSADNLFNSAPDQLYSTSELKFKDTMIGDMRHNGVPKSFAGYTLTVDQAETIKRLLEDIVGEYYRNVVEPRVVVTESDKLFDAINLETINEQVPQSLESGKEEVDSLLSEVVRTSFLIIRDRIREKGPNVNLTGHRFTQPEAEELRHILFSKDEWLVEAGPYYLASIKPRITRFM